MTSFPIIFAEGSITIHKYNNPKKYKIRNKRVKVKFLLSFCCKGWSKKMSWALSGTKVRVTLPSSAQEMTRAWIRTWACAISGSHQWEQWWNNSWERSLSWWEEPHLFIQPHIRVVELYKWRTMNKLAGQFQQLTKWPLIACFSWNWIIELLHWNKVSIYRKM